VIPLRLKPDQDLKNQIQEECQKHKMTAGFVVSGIGSLKTLKIRLANSSTVLEKNEKFEILTLQGSVSNEGLHLHISVADQNGQVLGGHLMPGCVIYTTAEILMMQLKDHEFTRAQDSKTGFLELEIRKK
jgi:predicted DNA-binding protein with PD1-like motif